MRKLSSVIAALVSSVGLVPVACADTADDLAVLVNVAPACTITSSSLDFGTSDAAVNGTTLIAVECTAGTKAQITLGEGLFADGASTPRVPLRRMADGAGNFLSYSLYSDRRRTILWSEQLLSGAPHLATSSTSDSLTLFGRSTGTRRVRAGAYTDTVVATILF